MTNRVIIANDEAVDKAEFEKAEILVQEFIATLDVEECFDDFKDFWESKGFTTELVKEYIADADDKGAWKHNVYEIISLSEKLCFYLCVGYGLGAWREEVSFSLVKPVPDISYKDMKHF